MHRRGNLTGGIKFHKRYQFSAVLAFSIPGVFVLNGPHLNKADACTDQWIPGEIRRLAYKWECGGKNWSSRAWTHLPEVPHVKQVKGVKELAVPQTELVMAHLEKRPDVLQTQKLKLKQGRGKKREKIEQILLDLISMFVAISILLQQQTAWACYCWSGFNFLHCRLVSWFSTDDYSAPDVTLTKTGWSRETLMLNQNQLGPWVTTVSSSPNLCRNKWATCCIINLYWLALFSSDHKPHAFFFPLLFFVATASLRLYIVVL